MAPKRQRNEGSSASRSYDHRRFVSEAASERYTNIMASRSITPERGFQPGVLQGELADIIRERGWRVFVRQPAPAVENIVREFYANAGEARDNVVTVRGKEVSFSPAAINEIYELPDEPGLDDYTRFKYSRINLAELIQSLCRPGATWTFRGEEAIHFAASDLSKYGKALYYFLCAKLMPTTHVSEIIKDRAILLYCLVVGTKINVGQVIHKSIQSTVTGSTTPGLPHPSLICDLCDKAGVEWNDEEEMQEPKVCLDERIIKKLKQWDGAPPHPRGAGFLIAQPQGDEPHSPVSEDEEPLAEPSSSRAPSTSAMLSENEFSIKLRRLQSHMDSRFTEVSQLLTTIAQRQDVMHTNHMHLTTALTDQFARLTPSQATLPFPQPQPLPSFPYPAPASSSAPAPDPNIVEDSDSDDF